MDRFLRIMVTAVVALLLLVGAFVGGMVFDRERSRVAGLLEISQSKETVGDKVDEVEQLLDAEALKVPTETSATAGAIQGLLDSTGDKYATYFDKTHFEFFNEQSAGEFGGIGVTIGEKDGTAYVVSVMSGTPADEAGMKKGDVFVSIDGVKQDRWDSDEVVKRVRGQEGATVKLQMQRGDQLKSFTLKRAKINLPNIASQMIGKDVGYIRLYSFNQKSTDDIRTAIKDLESKGAKGFVFDVRDNPGGLLDQAVDVASLFIPSGVIVRVEERDKPQEKHYATGRVATDVPVVMLVNGDSASASEIVAGAMQDYARSELVGEKTFGKGSVQTVEQLSSGGGVKFTIAHYLTPKSRTIDGVGVTPDTVVKMDAKNEYDAEFQKDMNKDVQLQKALDLLRAEL
jgi:carboxyl-terminal processing protease